MTVQKDGGKVTLFADDRIDAYTAPQFAAELEKALDGATDLTLDFTALKYISSSGLRVVMLAAKQMARQGEMRIVGIDEGVYEVLENTGFLGILDVERANE